MENFIALKFSQPIILPSSTTTMIGPSGEELEIINPKVTTICTKMNLNNFMCMSDFFDNETSFRSSICLWDGGDNSNTLQFYQKDPSKLSTIVDIDLSSQGKNGFLSLFNGGSSTAKIKLLPFLEYIYSENNILKLKFLSEKTDTIYKGEIVNIKKRYPNEKLVSIVMQPEIFETFTGDIEHFFPFGKNLDVSNDGITLFFLICLISILIYWLNK